MIPDFLASEAIAQGRLQRCLPQHASPRTPVFLSYRVGSEKIQRTWAVLELALAHVPGLLAASGSTYQGVRKG